jgi:acetyl-CoA synthetase
LYLLGRTPELYVTALGTSRNGCFFCPFFSAFGPEPLRIRMAIGEVRAGVRRITFAMASSYPYQRDFARAHVQLMGAAAS